MYVYLRRTVINRAIDILRRRKVEREDLKTGATEVLNYFERDNPYYIASRQETSRIIQEAITDLPPKLRDVQVRERDGMTNAEIADDLGIPLGTVKTRLRKAHEMLRNRLSTVLF